MKKLLLSIFLLGILILGFGQKRTTRYTTGWLYSINDWTYVETSERLMLDESISKDSTLSMAFIKHPPDSKFIAIPIHKNWITENCKSDNFYLTGPREHWTRSELAVQKVRLKQEHVLIEHKSYSSEWIIAGRGKSSRKLVWYLSPGPKEP